MATPSAAPDSGRKRAGEWAGTELDLDSYKTHKRFRSQEMACDLWGMNLDSSEAALSRQHPCSGTTAAGGAAAAAPTVSTGSLQDAAMLCSDGSPVSAMAISGDRQVQCTPRSESQTPSVHGGGPAAGPGGGAGGGGQPSVHSSSLRSRLAAQQATPMRLVDVLNLHPTSPSDPGLEGQLDLRKVTLMRSLQTRLLRAGDSSASPPGAALAAATAVLAAAEQQQQPRRQQGQGQSVGPTGCTSSNLGGPPLSSVAALPQSMPPGSQLGEAAQAGASTVSAVATSAAASSSWQGKPKGVGAGTSGSAMPAGNGSVLAGTPPYTRSRSLLDSAGACASMQISPQQHLPST